MEVTMEPMTMNVNVEEFDKLPVRGRKYAVITSDAEEDDGDLAQLEQFEPKQLHQTSEPHQLQMEIKKLQKVVLSFGFIVIVLLSIVIYGVWKDDNISSPDNSNAVAISSQSNELSESSESSDCTIDGMNLTSIIENNLLVNNESSNLTNTLLHEYLLSFYDDAYNGIADFEDYAHGGDGMEVMADDTSRRLLSHSCGNYRSAYFGGHGGHYFALEHPYDPCQRIRTICTRSGTLVDAIWVKWTDGKVSKAAGGHGGHVQCYTSPTGCITSAFIRRGSLVDGVLFSSSNGYISSYVGGHGGHKASVNFGACLTRIEGRAGHYIDNLRFGW